ncbi:GNAT family N-acetyltransferase [Leptospira interrogans]
MGEQVNTFGQPIGSPMSDWTARPRPTHDAIEGRLCRIEGLNPARHAADLHTANIAGDDGRGWTYMGYGPFATLQDYIKWAEPAAASVDPLYYTIIEKASGRAVGVASLMRIDPANGVIEVGNIKYSSALQRTPLATEAMFLLMRYVFDNLGYRRYEWKCDALNAPSRSAALRLGFTYEGIFRQAVIYKGRNRDTAWFSITDQEWPAIKGAYEAWLAPSNFDAGGKQKTRLADLISAARR